MTEGRTGRRRRPREHVIAEMGLNYLERQVLRRGHQLKRVAEPEYDIDAMMLHFSPGSREIENGWVEFQVKSTDEPRFVQDGQFVACTVETAHIHYWYWEVAHPVILVLYDATRHRGFWVEIQTYVESRGLSERRTLTVRIPARNQLSLVAIDRFRVMSLDRQPPRK